MATYATATQGIKPTFDSIGIRNRNISVADGQTLSPEQKVIVGSVLDLFEGRPSLKHLSLWQPTALFQDPIAYAQGYDRFAAQWYGLASLFDPIAIQSHLVTSGGNPIEVSLKNKYVLKGIKKEQVMDSVLKIHVGADGKIEMVEDRWNDKLPEEGGITGALRKLNANVASSLVKVPKTEEEDQKLQSERQGSQ